MALSESEITRIKSLITQLVNASIDASWAGSAHPDDWETIRERPTKIKARLDAYLKELKK